MTENPIDKIAMQYEVFRRGKDVPPIDFEYQLHMLKGLVDEGKRRKYDKILKYVEGSPELSWAQEIKRSSRLLIFDSTVCTYEELERAYNVIEDSLLYLKDGTYRPIQEDRLEKIDQVMKRKLGI